MSAVREGDITSVRRLLQDNADVNEKDYTGTSVLSRAAVGGHLEIVRMLLDKNATIDIRDTNGNTPLMSVISGYGSNREAVAALLVSKGASLEAKNEDGDTPMSLAIKKQRPQIVTMLKETVATRKRLAEEYARAVEDKRHTMVNEKIDKLRTAAKTKPKPGPKPPIAA